MNYFFILITTIFMMTGNRTLPSKNYENMSDLEGKPEINPVAGLLSGHFFENMRIFDSNWSSARNQEKSASTSSGFVAFIDYSRVLLRI
jgi:hypothetical protein